MEKDEKIQREKIGESGYLNGNCWLVEALGYAPYKRCQYCELKFHKCLFLHYQIISLILILLFITLSFLIEGEISELVVISVFTLVIVYGYFFNKSTDKIIKANFSQRKAKEALEELAERLEEKVTEQTKELQVSYQKTEKAFEIEKQAHKELKRLDEVKTQFIMATQHHLRTPLSILKGYLSMLLEGDYGELKNQSRETVVSCQVSVNRLIKLVNEFLDISQFQLGRGVIVLGKVKVRELLLEIIEELKPEAEKKGLEFKFEEPSLSSTKSPLEIKADSSKIKEAIFNILDNAIKYTEKGKVRLQYRLVGNKCQIIIQDTGIGISKEENANIFNRSFERGEDAKKVYALGRGIGLFIASSIIKEHQGKVWAESKGKNKGSVFYIELALAS